ncbi:MAG: sulfate adenylyltransferase [Candidatus Bathyarchaeia archaeon]
MIKPHGGELINGIVAREERIQTSVIAEELVTVSASNELRKDLENIAFGLYSPLNGPMIREDYHSVLKSGRLADDTPWTIPIVLDIQEEKAREIDAGDMVAISNQEERFALLEVDEKFPLSKREHALRVYGTLERAHPGVSKTSGMESILIGGQVKIFKETQGICPEYRLKPRETRFLFKEKGWRTVAGFQTRNPPHIGHEYVQKTALAFVDGLFINPLMGRKKRGDFRDEVIIKAYEALTHNYYLPHAATLVVLEMEMRYAGPREAIFHAIIRKNYGCTHFIVGRDHAGVGSYYGPYEAQEKFEEYPDLGITPLFFRSFFHCKKCGGPQNEKVCPHGEEERINFSGTRIRKILQNGETPPGEMMRSEVSKAILSYKEPFVN